MTYHWLVYACLATGVGSALVAGVFQSFSDFVMRGLIAAKPAGGIESMQMINRTVYRSAFIVMLLGLAPVMIAIAAIAGMVDGGLAAVWTIVGATTYVLSVVAVTMIGNVPMNKRLDRLDFASADAATYWRVYGVNWTRLNHLRTVGSLLSAICFLAASIILA